MSSNDEISRLRLLDTTASLPSTPRQLMRKEPHRHSTRDAPFRDDTSDAFEANRATRLCICRLT